MPNKLSKIAIIISSISIGTFTTLLELPMLPPNLAVPYVAFKIWLFGIVPIIFYTIKNWR